MSEMGRVQSRIEYGSMCADGEFIGNPGSEEMARRYADHETWGRHCPCGGPHRVVRRQITEGPWEAVDD